MVGWIRNVFTVPKAGPVVDQGAEEINQKGKPRLFDLTDGYFLVEEAKKWGISLIRRSWDDFEEFRKKVTTRRKVRKSLTPAFDLSDIVDEVTEKLMDASHDDKRLKRLVG